LRTESGTNHVWKDKVVMDYWPEIQGNEVLIKEFLIQLRQNPALDGFDSDEFLKSRIAQIDFLLSAQVNEIIHHPEFQKLEAAWRGLYHLVNALEGEPSVKIQIFPVAKKDLFKDFEKALTVEQTSIYRKVYYEKFTAIAEPPFGLLIGDYEFTSNWQDLKLLEYLSELAEDCNAPFISYVSPEFFNYSSLSEIKRIEKLFDRLNSVERQRWNNFRELYTSRSVGLCLQRILFRLPYGDMTVPPIFWNGKYHLKNTVKV
jgi:type VI secretion system protein ImpC